MKRFFNIVLGSLAMLVVALVSAFITMRLAIHGREVKVPDLVGMSVPDAGREASSLGLRLNLENKFYSANTPPGQVLAQSPAPGATVRRQWAVRVTESLGAQQVSIPDLMGQSERTASINIRRLSLDLGTVASVDGGGDQGVVLAQTPEPNASGVDRPRVSLLLGPLDDAVGKDAKAKGKEAIVMPSLTGLPLMSAAARASAAGLRVVSAEEIRPAAPVAAAVGSGAAIPAVGVPGASTATVVAQTPLAGYRVLKGDAVRLAIAYPGYSGAVTTTLP